MTLVEKLKNWLNVTTTMLALGGAIIIGIGSVFLMYSDVKELKADQNKIQDLEKHMIGVQVKLDEMEKRFDERFDNMESLLKANK